MLNARREVVSCEGETGVSMVTEKALLEYLSKRSQWSLQGLSKVTDPAWCDFCGEETRISATGRGLMGGRAHFQWEVGGGRGRSRDSRLETGRV